MQQCKWGICLFIIILFFSCDDQENPAEPEPEPTVGTVKDADDNEYATIKIGEQWWMAENLRALHYSNHDPIPNITDNNEWAALNDGAYCNYNNNSVNARTHGVLYNWYAVKDSRDIAPYGWHVPTDADWKELEQFLGLDQENTDATGWRGTIEGGLLKLTGIDLWNDPNTAAADEYGFAATPGGVRYGYHGEFVDMGHTANFWTISEGNSSSAWSRSMASDQGGIARSELVKRFGLSVRCVRD